MTPEFAAEVIKAMILQAATLAAPVLVTAMTIGLAVSLFQAVTSIQEQTLTFVPKVVGICGLLIVLLPWLLRSTIEFTTALFQKLPQMVQ
jgi:flagellar biosynthetic protein FliQ